MANGGLTMIQIDIQMPKSCKECPFCEDSNCSIMPGIPAWINVSKYTNTRSEHCILINGKDFIEEGQTVPNREKVIKGLKICTTRPCYCTDCPYKANCVLDSQELMEDALALIKEQEGIINELQNAYDYLQKQFFEAQDKMLKEK